ncbi:MAG: exodeoxyribonuclease VII small subunit [Planctomycetes bacterium]|nr:exodeoxyribonuclease VII small subunit [Planctomycetota bacterium]MCW8136557.1 exodeoxyribonuclease VII small subunit [Planctomycetota bacterium]
MAKKKEDLKFEELVAQVEAALQQLEAGDLPLEEALKRYEDGVAALRRCFDILKQAEKKVMQLSERDTEPTEFAGNDEEPKGKLF